MLKVIGTALLTAFVTSMFWIWFYNFMPQPRATVSRSGPVVTVKPENAPPVVLAQQVQVAPSGLALPVVGVKPEQLVDTYDQARGAGRRHDAIDIMAAEGTPVIAVADGRIEKLFNSVRGGSLSTSARPTSNGSIITPICRATRPASPKGSRSSAAKSSVGSATRATRTRPVRTSTWRSTAWRRVSA